ncbi:MAG: ATP-dependent Clp protease proteolytic subunit [Alphaproteobacteria bacterium]|nr:ATP-dependent Clp protease proteolytic subunit [Alphaproteobacteria bacterium]
MTPRETQAVDLTASALRDRIVFLGTQVNSDGQHATGLLLYLEAIDAKKPITPYINSPVAEGRRRHGDSR